MRILVDQNLPPRMLPLLEGRFPGSLHVNEAGLSGAKDIEVWRYALVHGMDIMSRDRDFALLTLRKLDDICVVWIRVGNIAIRDLLHRIAAELPGIATMLGARSARIIEIR